MPLGYRVRMQDKARELIESARRLAPLLERHAAEAEELRRPHDDVIAGLREAGIFDLMVPRCHGGLELDLDTFLEVGLALAEGDASMAWAATFYIEHNWMLCQFPESFQKELYENRSHILAPASLTPDGRLEEVRGGYRLYGRWKWGTGLPHAEWVICGGQTSPKADPLFLALPIEDVRVEDTWWADGMSATGSGDWVADGAMVPEERTVSVRALGSATAPGADLHPSPLYQTPMTPILVQAAAMPAVGQVRAALRRFKADIQERRSYFQEIHQSDRPAMQMRLAQLEIGADRVERELRLVVSDVMARRNAATIEERAGWLARTAWVVNESREIIRSIADGSGASAHFRTHPLQRAVRDLNTISSHTVFDLEQRLETYGRTLLGLDPQGIL